MASKLKVKVNGLVHSVTASLDTRQAAAVMAKGGK